LIKLCLRALNDIFNVFVNACSSLRHNVTDYRPVQRDKSVAKFDVTARDQESQIPVPQQIESVSEIRLLTPSLFQISRLRCVHRELKTCLDCAVMRLNLRRFRQSLSRDVSVPVTQQAPPVPALFPTAINIIHVADWSADIRASPDASPCYVESIDFKKAIRPNHHEYLLIRVRHPGFALCAVLIVDRCPTSIWRLPSPPVAPDIVTISPDGDEHKIAVHGPCETLSTLTFPIIHPSVLDLCALLAVLNPHNPFHAVGDYKCYWYAGVLFDIMKLEFQAMETFNPLASLTRANYKGYFATREHTTQALRNKFAAKSGLYARERRNRQKAREAPTMLVSGYF